MGLIQTAKVANIVKNLTSIVNQLNAVEKSLVKQNEKVSAKIAKEQAKIEAANSEIEMAKTIAGNLSVILAIPVKVNEKIINPEGEIS